MCNNYCVASGNQSEGPGGESESGLLVQTNHVTHSFEALQPQTLYHPMKVDCQEMKDFLQVGSEESQRLAWEEERTRRNLKVL